MEFVETRNMHICDLRNLCIKRNWYTRGTNAEYSNLFDMLSDSHSEPVNMTTAKLAEIAADIMAHSEMHPDYEITSVMYELAQICHTFFDVKGGADNG